MKKTRKNKAQTATKETKGASPTKPKKSTKGASPVNPKTTRRTQAEITRLKQIMYEMIKHWKPMTVRQVFYQMSVRGHVSKLESGYKAVQRMLTQMRKSDELPYHWIADNTRWMRKPQTYGGLSEMLEAQTRLYRRSLWDMQDAYVEIWLEKEALAGVLVQVTEKWDVPLMVTRGYPSLSFVFSAAQNIADQTKPAHLYYFGDHDPSGVDIDRKLEEQLREMAPFSKIHFRRVAVTEQQILEMQLPTRPTKKTDSRAKNFEGDSVEVDAIAPDVLRDICRQCIEQHVDKEQLTRAKLTERAERETLQGILKQLQ